MRNKLAKLLHAVRLHLTGLTFCMLTMAPRSIFGCKVRNGKAKVAQESSSLKMAVFTLGAHESKKTTFLSLYLTFKTVLRSRLQQNL